MHIASIHPASPDLVMEPKEILPGEEIFIAEFFIVEHGKQSKCPPMKEVVNSAMSSHAIEWYRADYTQARSPTHITR